MGFYEERIMPIVNRTVDEMLKTNHMQSIINGTMPLEKFQFQLKHNFQYLKAFCRCWATGLARTNDYDEMLIWYSSLKAVFEDELGESMRYWMDATGLTFADMEEATMAEGKASYSAFETARTWSTGDNASQVMSMCPCTVLYMYFGEKAVAQCTLPEGNMYRHWLEVYVSDWYKGHCQRSIDLVNKLCQNKSEEELNKLVETFAISCNYEVLQWNGVYETMETWPLADLIPERSKIMRNWPKVPERK